jgi:ABC-type branched-subunit amino acid transport system substrate-binding protein
MILIQAIQNALQKGALTPQGPQDHAGATRFRQAVLQALSHLRYSGATGDQHFDANGDTTNQTISLYQLDPSAKPPNWRWLTQRTV